MLHGIEDFFFKGKIENSVLSIEKIFKSSEEKRERSIYLHGMCVYVYICIYNTNMYLPLKEC